MNDNQQIAIMSLTSSASDCGSKVNREDFKRWREQINKTFQSDSDAAQLAGGKNLFTFCVATLGDLGVIISQVRDPTHNPFKFCGSTRLTINLLQKSTAPTDTQLRQLYKGAEKLMEPIYEQLQTIETQFEIGIKDLHKCMSKADHFRNAKDDTLPEAITSQNPLPQIAHACDSGNVKGEVCPAPTPQNHIPIAEATPAKRAAEDDLDDIAPLPKKCKKPGTFPPSHLFHFPQFLIYARLAPRTETKDPAKQTRLVPNLYKTLRKQRKCFFFIPVADGFVVNDDRMYDLDELMRSEFKSKHHHGKMDDDGYYFIYPASRKSDDTMVDVKLAIEAGIEDHEYAPAMIHDIRYNFHIPL